MTSDTADMVSLVAGVTSEATEWEREVEAAVAATLPGQKRAEFDADAARLEQASMLFQDTPDDRSELLNL